MTNDPSSQNVPVAEAVSEPDRRRPANPPAVIVRQGSSSLLWRVLAFLGWAGFGIAALIVLGQLLAFRDYFDNTHGITEKYHSGAKFGSTKVAIIAVEGLIADPEGFVKNQIDQVREDDDIKAVVVRVNSPGGTVTASDYLFHHLKKLREERQIPLVVSMGGIAASGGYYVSMAVGDTEKSIFAEPTTTTGSIGVMMPHYDVSGLMERFDVKDDSLVTHPRKEMGSMTKPMPEEHRQLLQNYIDESFARFKDIVKEGRPQFREEGAALDELATGEIFSATRAKEKGLVDEIGFIEEAIDRAMELAGLNESDVRVVMYERPLSLFDFGGLALAPSGSRQSSDLTALLDLATPRAYYLATTLPPALSTYIRLVK